MRIFCSLVTLLALFAAESLAQYTTSQVLATAHQDVRVLSSQALADYAASLNAHDPILKGIEARVGTNGSALGDTIYGYLRNEDTYGLIFTTNSLREIKRQKAIQVAKVAAYHSESRVWFENAVKSRYEALVQYFSAQQQLIHLQSLAQLLKKKQDILRAMTENGLEIKVKDVIDTEANRLKTAAQIMELERNMRNSLAEIQLFINTSDDIRLDSSGFISLRQILLQVQSPAPIAPVFPDIDFRNSKLQIETAKEAYVNSQNRQIFQSLRVGYDRPLYLMRPNKFNTFNNLALRIGLAVPLPSNNRFRKASAQLDRREAESAVARATVTQIANAASIRKQIEELYQFHINCSEQAKSSLIPVLLNNDQMKTSLSPLDLVELEITQHNLSQRNAQTAGEILQLYIAYLQASGMLTAEPFVNYLSGASVSW